ncbi:MAG: class I SAM-dependent RNA methyltransferase [Acidobacteriota bacterium]|nr:class I SAM-dependent RNA methyltransferase [Blastocatellia bacterium]MDW8412418.1 class I SAM-dependent RNA methyltransferase [Acidobacteriota bacterium]
MDLKGACFKVTVEKLAYGGDGIARLGSQVVFVPRSAPKDVLLVRISSVEKHYLRAEPVTIIEPSPWRREPACPRFGICGGCQLQHLRYEAQLAAKAEFIKEALRRIAHIEVNVPILYSEEFGYRSRAQFKIAYNPLRVGFYQSGTNEVCDIDYCYVLEPVLNQTLQELKQSTFHSNSTKVDVASGQDGKVVVKGMSSEEDYVQRSVLGITYRYCAGSFFQVNSKLLEALVATAVADFGGDLGVDLYAGVGLFSLQLARRFGKIIAAEVNPLAAKWAATNIALNKLTNVDYRRMSAEKCLQMLCRNCVRPDLLLLDPPRAGASPKVVSSILALRPKHVVYVSCEPTTLARDLKVLLEKGYSLASITGIDLFPQSYHVETIATLRA